MVIKKYPCRKEKGEKRHKRLKTHCVRQYPNAFLY